MESHLTEIAAWQTRGGKYWVKLYRGGSDAWPYYQYETDNGAGLLGQVTRADAEAACERQASYAPSQCKRVK